MRRVHSFADDVWIVSSQRTEVNEAGFAFNPLGCIDLDGNVVIPLEYDHVEFLGGVVKVGYYKQGGSKYGLLDKKGQEVVAEAEPAKDAIHHLCSGFLLAVEVDTAVGNTSCYS